jgi:WXG100 family type VII secretion target
MPTGSANWQAMTALADQVDGIRGEMQGQLRGLQQSLETLAPQWQSDAAQSFYALNQRWSDDSGQLNRALEEIASGLRSTASAYQAADASASEGLH